MYGSFYNVFYISKFWSENFQCTGLLMRNATRMRVGHQEPKEVVQFHGKLNPFWKSTNVDHQIFSVVALNFTAVNQRTESVVGRMTLSMRL